MIGIYIHIPFCKKKCPYCDFYSFKADENQKDSYLSAVLSSLINWSEKIDCGVDSIYFGGGTPSVFGFERINRVISCIEENFNLQNAQITVECNPDSATKEFLFGVAKGGVNRISMGVQSAIKREREVLGRVSDINSVENAVLNAKKAGIEDISLDLMLGVPYQTIETLGESIDFLTNLDITHISAYMLKIEDGTPFYKERNNLSLPDEDEVCDMYLFTVDKLKEKGFMQYEISNFAKNGLISRHNMKYWNCEEYLGIGPSAHSFLFGKRFYYSRDFDSFLTTQDVIYDGEGGTDQEYIMLRLRLSEGLVFSEFEKRFLYDIKDEMLKKAREFEKHGFLKCDDKAIALTKEGFLLSNTIISQLLCDI